MLSIKSQTKFGEGKVQENKRKKEYETMEIWLFVLPQEDIIRTSYVGDNNGDWEDEDAQPTGRF